MVCRRRRTRQFFLEDRDLFRAENAFYVPEESRWAYIISNAKQDNIKEILDLAMKQIEEENHELEGMLPRIFQATNLPAENVTGKTLTNYVRYYKVKQDKLSFQQLKNSV